MDIILILLIIAIPFASHMYINSVYSETRGKANSKGLCGQEVARKILDANGLDKVHVVEVNGILTDHYDPRRNVVRLSTEVFHGESIAALAVAAHECGHAIQDKEGYPLLRLRALLVPVVNLVNYTAYIVFLASMLLQVFDYIYWAAAMVFITLIFQLVTLPVEFNASSRALKQIKKESLVSKSDSEGAERMLKAAALTYVAALLSSLLNLLRILSRIRNRD